MSDIEEARERLREINESLVLGYDSARAHHANLVRARLPRVSVHHLACHYIQLKFPGKYVVDTCKDLEDVLIPNMRLSVYWKPIIPDLMRLLSILKQLDQWKNSECEWCRGS